MCQVTFADGAVLECQPRLLTVSAPCTSSGLRPEQPQTAGRAGGSPVSPGRGCLLSTGVIFHVRSDLHIPQDFSCSP